MTAIPDISEFTASTVTEAQFKAALTNLRTYLVERLGADAVILPGFEATGDVKINKIQPWLLFLPDATSTGAGMRIQHNGNDAINRMFCNFNYTDGSFLIRTHAADGASVVSSILAKADKVLELNTAAAGVGSGQANVPYPVGGANNAVSVSYLTNWGASATVLAAQTANSANAVAANVVDGADLKFIGTPAEVITPGLKTSYGGMSAYWYEANLIEGIYVPRSLPALARDIVHYVAQANEWHICPVGAPIFVATGDRLGVESDTPGTIDLIKVL